MNKVFRQLLNDFSCMAFNYIAFFIQYQFYKSSNLNALFSFCYLLGFWYFLTFLDPNLTMGCWISSRAWDNNLWYNYQWEGATKVEHFLLRLCVQLLQLSSRLISIMFFLEEIGSLYLDCCILLSSKVIFLLFKIIGIHSCTLPFVVIFWLV